MHKIPARTVARLLDSVAFLNWQYGLAVNGMITLNFNQAGISEAGEANRALTRLNEALADRLARLQRGLPEEQRKPYLFIYAHEHVESHGHHVHQLVALPRTAEINLPNWLQRWVKRTFGAQVPTNAIHCRARFYVQHREAVAQQKKLVRYILKSAADAIAWTKAGEPIPLHEVLGIEGENHYSTAAIRKPVGWAQAIGRKAQLSSCFEPPFYNEALSGQGLDDYRTWHSRSRLTQQLLRIEV